MCMRINSLFKCISPEPFAYEDNLGGMLGRDDGAGLRGRGGARMPLPEFVERVLV